jgi:hypothetical protein
VLLQTTHTTTLITCVRACVRACEASKLAPVCACKLTSAIGRASTATCSPARRFVVVHISTSSVGLLPLLVCKQLSLILQRDLRPVPAELTPAKLLRRTFLYTHTRTRTHARIHNRPQSRCSHQVNTTHKSLVLSRCATVSQVRMH